jgi:hypothetical protein
VIHRRTPAILTAFLVLAGSSWLAYASMDPYGDRTMCLQGSLRVGNSSPLAWPDGYVYAEQGAQFRCSGCGNQAQLLGSADWGNLTIQGRVLSGSAAIHLSPPAGSNVIIDDAYRAAGGAGGGAPGLVVEGGGSFGGGLSVGGDFNRGCPGGMTKIGSTCIGQPFANNGTSWQDTNLICRDGGNRMCTFAEVNFAAIRNVLPSYDIGTLDRWVWVDDTQHTDAGCHVNLNFNQGGEPEGSVNCGVNIYTNHASIAGICCK